MIAFPNPIILLIVLLGGAGDVAALAGAQVARGAEVLRGLDRATAFWSRSSTSALIVLLAFGMTETHIERDFGDV